MSGWETLVAALGGLSVGVGLGILLGRRGEDRLRRQVSSMQRRVRTTLMPILEERADALGLSARDRDPVGADPVEVALMLGEDVRRAEERQALPFSDTVELTAGAHAGAGTGKSSEREKSKPNSSEHEGEPID